MKIRVAMLDFDKIYVSRFFAIFNNSYSSKIEIHAFTNERAFYEFLNNNDVEILLVHEDVKFTVKPENKVQILTLVEKNKLENQINSIFKYQKISLIYKEILNAYSKVYRSVSFCEKNSRSNIISLMSSGTGSGNSSLSAALCLRLSQKGKKTLLLDLQSFATINCIFSTEGKFSMSEIVYAIKSHKADISIMLESAVKSDISGVFFYDPCKNPLERAEISGEDIKKLLEVLKSLGIYEYIIIDTEYKIDETTMEIINYSDKVFLTTSPSEESCMKLDFIIKSIELLSKQSKKIYSDKISIIYNKYVNNRAKTNESKIMKTVCYIPKFSEADIKSIAYEISKSSALDNLVDLKEVEIDA